jgi:hypothetical protein
LVRQGETTVMARFRCENADVVTLLTSRLIDPDSEADANLDARRVLLALVLPLMGLRFVAGGIGWSACNRYANIIIDDPPLAKRYGHIDFLELRNMARKRNARFTLAYIPCNYRRGGRRTVQFFRESADCFSFCVHGAFHTKREFGERPDGRIHYLARFGLEQMQRFRQRTGLRSSSIMVFPQGVFSSNSMVAMSSHGYTCAVNTEIRDVSGKRIVRVRDLLRPAFVGYGGIHLFLRRRVGESEANLAFDQLLGRPLLFVAHQQDFANHMSRIRELCDKLERLPEPPEWRPLEEIVSRTFSVRRNEDNAVEFRFYCLQASLDSLNSGSERGLTRILVDGIVPERVDSVRIEETDVVWSTLNDSILIKVQPGTGGNLTIALTRQTSNNDRPLSVKERAEAWLRRLLSEFRDNVISRFLA